MARNVENQDIVAVRMRVRSRGGTSLCGSVSARIMLGKRAFDMPENCPHCGAVLPLVGDAFCSQCREPLDEEPEVSPTTLPSVDTRPTVDSTQSDNERTDVPVELVTVLSFDKRAEADLCKVILEQEGIRAFVADDNLVGGINFLYANAVGGIKVQVSSEDADQAAALLQGFRSNWGFPDSRYSCTDSDGEIRLECEFCGEQISFLRSEQGSVQKCPHCEEYIDIPESH